MGLWHMWRDLDSYPLVGTSIIFTMVFRSHANYLERLTIDLYHARKQARWHLRAFTSRAILTPVMRRQMT